MMAHFVPAQVEELHSRLDQSRLSRQQKLQQLGAWTSWEDDKSSSSVSHVSRQADRTFAPKPDHKREPNTKPYHDHVGEHCTSDQGPLSFDISADSCEGPLSWSCSSTSHTPTAAEGLGSCLWCSRRDQHDHDEPEAVGADFGGGTRGRQRQQQLGTWISWDDGRSGQALHRSDNRHSNPCSNANAEQPADPAEPMEQLRDCLSALDSAMAALDSTSASASRGSLALSTTTPRDSQQWPPPTGPPLTAAAAGVDMARVCHGTAAPLAAAPQRADVVVRDGTAAADADVAAVRASLGPPVTSNSLAWPRHAAVDMRLAGHSSPWPVDTRLSPTWAEVHELLVAIQAATSDLSSVCARMVPPPAPRVGHAASEAAAGNVGELHRDLLSLKARLDVVAVVVNELAQHGRHVPDEPTLRGLCRSGTEARLELRRSVDNLACTLELRQSLSAASTASSVTSLNVHIASDGHIIRHATEAAAPPIGLGPCASAHDQQPAECEVEAADELDLSNFDEGKIAHWCRSRSKMFDPRLLQLQIS